MDAFQTLKYVVVKNVRLTFSLEFDPSMTPVKVFVVNIDHVAIMYGIKDLILTHEVSLNLRENARR